MTTTLGQRRWLPKELTQMQDMHLDGYSFRDIADALQRTEGSCRSTSSQRCMKYRLDSGVRRPSRPRTKPIMPKHYAGEPREQIPSLVFIRREARAEAARQRSITGQLCGDPPVGYSEFDKRRRA